MVVRQNEEAEFRQAYIELLGNLADRSKDLLKAREAQGHMPFQSPTRDFVVRIDGAEVYRRDLVTNEVKALEYTPELAQKLRDAVERPTTLQGEV